MAVSFTIRPMTVADGPALMALSEQTPDTGAMGFHHEYLQDFLSVQQALRPGMMGMVAEVEGYDGLAGSAIVRVADYQLEGDVVPCAYLGGLGVHPDFRRQGIASALAQARIDYARDQIGDKGAIFAGIQGGNEGSLKVAKKWANQIIEDRNGISIYSITKRQPPKLDGVTVRPARQEELPEIIDRQNTFFAKANFYPPKTADQIAGWLDEKPFGDLINQYYVAVDDGGNLLAGVGVTRESLLEIMHIVRVPLPMRIVNLFVRMIPPDGITRTLNGHWIWYADGQENAGAYVWPMACWLERDFATTGTIFYDHQGPLNRVLEPPRFGPSGGGYLVVNAPVTLQPENPLYFNKLML